MSTILKALRRLEQERTKGAEKPLREQVVLARARRRGPWAVWLATGVALSLGFAATWAVLSGYDEPSAAPAALPAPPAPVAAAPPAAATPPARVAPGALAAAPPFEPPAPAPRPAAAPTPPRVVEAPPPPRVAAAPPPAETSPARAPEPVYADEDPVLTAPITGRAPRFADDEEDPARRARVELPVSVVRTSWHPQAERRAAWVAIAGESPREVKEGEWVGAYEVRSIEPDGVLFADGPLLVHRPVGER